MHKKNITLWLSATYISYAGLVQYSIISVVYHFKRQRKKSHDYITKHRKRILPNPTFICD